MCGIIGHISNQTLTSEELQTLEVGLMSLFHRGPDSGSSFNSGTVFLGHRRLSIIDLSDEAAQPFKSGTQDAYIVFNGEIYNYKEISADLDLRTKSDTEVLLEGYLKHGISFFQKIRGIYAFAIYDKRNNEMIMLRDPGGVKPFYYSHSAYSFSFASEIKALIPGNKNSLTINKEIIKTYIHLGYIPEPATIYNEIKALIPGTLYKLNCETLQVSTQHLNEYRFDTTNTLSFNDNLNKSETLLKTAAKRNLVSDVDVNIALSGGIDSSLVYAYANEVSPTRGITVKQHEEEFDESTVAKIYAKHLGAPHLIIDTQVENKIALLNKLLLHFDQPYADSSFIPTYFLCKAASGYSKVLIGGDSGDEIHNGYSGYRVLPSAVAINKNSILRPMALAALRGLKLFTKGSKKREVNKLISLVNATDINELLFNWNSWFPTNTKSYPFNPFLYDTSSVYKSFTSYNANTKGEFAITDCYFNKRMLSDYLRKSEMMAMLNSLEFRVPMLDEDLVRFSLTIPYQQKSKGKTQKIILRKLHEKVYPKETSQLIKKGFSIPLDTWLGEENLELIKTELKRKDGILNSYIKEEYIDTLFATLTDKNLQEYCSRESAYERILILYSLQLWYLQTYKKLIAA